MISYSFTEIFNITGGQLVNPDIADPQSVRFLSFDSRTILSGKETLFFALKSERDDGHRFIDDAISREVSMFVVEVLPLPTQANAHARFIIVPGSLEALQKLAAFHRRRFTYPVAGITGSNGKTIVKEWLGELLSPDFKIVRSPRSYNSQIGNPLSVWLMDDRYNLAIFEAGISKPGEMEKLQYLLQPDHGIFTHLGKAHLENFNSADELVDEKLKLFVNSSLIIYCKDFELLCQAIKRATFNNNPRFFSWSSVDSKADLRIIQKTKNEGFTRIEGIFQSKMISVIIPFTDDASIENAIHCWAYMLATSFIPHDFQERFRKISPIAMRLELKRGINGCTIINDSYNSDTASLVNALDFIGQQADNRKKRCRTKVLDTGKLIAVDNQINAATGTVMLKAEFLNENRGLFPNQFVNARLLLTTVKNALTIPTAAISTGAPGTYVYVIDKTSKVTLRRVTTGVTYLDTTTIASGLKMGERVVTDGLDRLRDGSQVQIITPSASGTTRADQHNGHRKP